MNLEVSTFIFFLTCLVGKPAWGRTERNPINQLPMSGAIGALVYRSQMYHPLRYKDAFHSTIFTFQLRQNEKDLLFRGSLLIRIYVFEFSQSLYSLTSNEDANKPGKRIIRYVPICRTVIATLIA